MNPQELISSGLLELYAAEKLSPEERREVEALLSTDEDVQAELHRIEEAMEGFARAYAMKPSRDILGAALKEIEAAQVSAADPIRPQPQTDTAPMKVVHRSLDRRMTLFAVAASVLLIVSLGLNVYFSAEITKASDRQEAMLERQLALDQQFEAVVNNLSKVNDQYYTLTEMLHDKNTRLVHLDPMASEGSQGMVIWNPSTKEVHFELVSLPEPPSDKEYQLWAIVDGTPVDAGMIAMSPGMQTLKSLNGQPAAFAVTLEPMGGSPQPTSDIYILGSV